MMSILCDIDVPDPTAHKIICIRPEKRKGGGVARLTGRQPKEKDARRLTHPRGEMGWIIYPGAGTRVKWDGSITPDGPGVT